MTSYNRSGYYQPTGAAMTGEHSELHPILGVLQDGGLCHAQSMEMTNDPRFFRKSVLNKRLAAFASLSVVSSFMIGTSSSVISMKKDMNVYTYEGMLQFVSFSIMAMVLFLNVVATYIGVAQTYHAYRLETAGPTGFEMATSYYLNPNIVSWRHLAVKGMLNSLPMFLISTGIRVQISFANDVERPVPPSSAMANTIGFLFMLMYFAMAVLLWYLHFKHTAIFRERYNVVSTHTDPYVQQVRQMMTQSGRNGAALDV
jgi:hypothetical protein